MRLLGEGGRSWCYCLARALIGFSLGNEQEEGWLRRCSSLSVDKHRLKRYKWSDSPELPSKPVYLEESVAVRRYSLDSASGHRYSATQLLSLSNARRDILDYVRNNPK